MTRVLFLLLVLATSLARASDVINAPTFGNSVSVTQPHVVAELIPDYTAIRTGKPFAVALHLHMDAGWHTYWINPGDAGLATTIRWTLPPGFTAGPIQWPTPEKHNMGPLITYGYGGDVYLLTTITPPADRSTWPPNAEIKAKASWLVCQEECIPGKGEFSFLLATATNKSAQAEDDNCTKFFAKAQQRLPVPDNNWHVESRYADDFLDIVFIRNADDFAAVPKDARFFPEQANVLSNLDTDNGPAENGGKPLADGRADRFRIRIKLQQNGDKPDKLSGVLVSEQPLIGDAKSIYIPEFPVTSEVAAAVPSGGSAVSANPNPPLAEPSQGPATATLPTSEQPLLIAVLGAAFVGGLILNLMPCVLPVLSLKVFSLMKHAGENPKAAWIQGAAFTAGVVISFWALAGLLIALRTAGNHLGWGFQMQSPGFVLALIFLFFLLGLNLFGVFELGSSLVGLDAKATNHLGGLASSFGNGALATLAATPCTAPFMGSALGFAAQQPAIVSLLIFTFLALGMATPYLLLTIFPGALRFVPKPGAWMEAFKQFMGFLLMATVIFLIYVFGALVGEEQIPDLLFLLLICSLLAWIYGRWGSRFVWIRFLTIFLFILSIAAFQEPTAASGLKAKDTAAAEDGWQPWSQDAVDAALAKNQPVFVDFTAAWCLSCKVNERVALGTDAVKKAFTDKNVALFKADWTHSDPAISQTLQKFNRDGVPLYLLYSPKDKAQPQVLPEVLTPGIVLDALGKL
jgi:thiol:disulfide interchange protein/DsbC/DsbD-like thiol-disulfide interchange protein